MYNIFIGFNIFFSKKLVNKNQYTHSTIQSNRSVYMYVCVCDRELT